MYFDVGLVPLRVDHAAIVGHSQYTQRGASAGPTDFRLIKQALSNQNGEPNRSLRLASKHLVEGNRVYRPNGNATPQTPITASKRASSDSHYRQCRAIHPYLGRHHEDGQARIPTGLHPAHFHVLQFPQSRVIYLYSPRSS